MAELQPLHPSILPLLDNEYAEYHKKYIAHTPAIHTVEWDPAIRNAKEIFSAVPEPEEVGSVADFNLSKCEVRVYTPKGEAPSGGWPCYLFFHGGGWTLGNIASEASYCARMCNAAKCVVASVNYRLSPENPYPAAVEDAVESLHWVYNQGPSKVKINPSKIAVGGSSSGGNLAAILTLKSAELTIPIPIIFQLLIVPVTDNTAQSNDPKGVYPSWTDNVHTPWLSPGRMLWFRNNYLPNLADRTKWDASPMFASDALLKRVPPAWVAVTELDLLRDEGISYADRLRKVGIEAVVEVYKRAPHPIMALSGNVISVGTKLVTDAGHVLAKAFGTQA